jgi:hypothetical protein
MQTLEHGSGIIEKIRESVVEGDRNRARALEHLFQRDY